MRAAAAATCRVRAGCDRVGPRSRSSCFGLMGSFLNRKQNPVPDAVVGEKQFSFYRFEFLAESTTVTLTREV